MEENGSNIETRIEKAMLVMKENSKLRLKNKTKKAASEQQLRSCMDPSTFSSNRHFEHYSNTDSALDDKDNLFSKENAQNWKVLKENVSLNSYNETVEILKTSIDKANAQHYDLYRENQSLKSEIEKLKQEMNSKVIEPRANENTPFGIRSPLNVKEYLAHIERDIQKISSLEEKLEATIDKFNKLYNPQQFTFSQCPSYKSLHSDDSLNEQPHLLMRSPDWGKSPLSKFND